MSDKDEIRKFFKSKGFREIENPIDPKRRMHFVMPEAPEIGTPACYFRRAYQEAEKSGVPIKRGTWFFTRIITRLFSKKDILNSAIFVVELA